MNTYSLDLEASSSQYADRADTTSLSITGDLTIEAWVKPESAAQFSVFSKFKSVGNLKSYEFSVVPTSTLRLNISANGADETEVLSTGTVSTGVWTHVAVSYDASAGTCEFYINGVWNSQGTSLPTSINDNASRPTLGARAEDGNLYFDGLIDEVRVWNDIRIDTEILANYNTELVGSESGLVGYWKLNNDYTDETANANDLTASGSPVFSTDVPFTEAVGFIFISS